jgi:hypothetical protein
LANYLTVIHECKDYPTWKKAYDADAPNRAAAGVTDIHVLREHANANLVALIRCRSRQGIYHVAGTSGGNHRSTKT